MKCCRAFVLVGKKSNEFEYDDTRYQTILFIFYNREKKRTIISIEKLNKLCVQRVILYPNRWSIHLWHFFDGVFDYYDTLADGEKQIVCFLFSMHSLLCCSPFKWSANSMECARRERESFALIATFALFWIMPMTYSMKMTPCLDNCEWRTLYQSVVCKFMFENFTPIFLFGSKIAVKYIAIKLNRFFSAYCQCRRMIDGHDVIELLISEARLVSFKWTCCIEFFCICHNHLTSNLNISISIDTNWLYV